jgi:tetratricopeptide (TPR) repeat protein
VATSVEEDPERAYQYAQAARGLAARVGIVRETAAIAAYQAGKWADALAEFRAARRLTGRDTYLPLMADCERALGRLDRALDIVTGQDAQAADRPTQIELRIVESGIRRDQGLPDAGVVALQIPELTQRPRPGSARLFYAYADALFDAGREEEAREWFAKAAAADPADETDAADRLDELDEILFDDLAEEDDDEASADSADDEDSPDDEDSADDEDSPDDEDSADDEDDEADGADSDDDGPDTETGLADETGAPDEAGL